MDLCKILDELGIVYTIKGNSNFDSMGLANYNSSVGSILTFIESSKYVSTLKNVTLVLTNCDTAKYLTNYSYCMVSNPRVTFFKVHNYLTEKMIEKSETHIGVNCTISELSYIAPYNVVIGDNVIIEEFVSIKENVIIGDNSVIRCGAIIGGEGFEIKNDDGHVFSVKHAGKVNVGDNVEIQYNTTVDKAVYPWDSTIIEEGTRIDNLVHIAHGVKIGRAVEIAANACIAGRVTIGNNTWIGPNAAIVNGLSIGNNARVNIGSVVTQSVSDNKSVTGNFAIEHSKFITNIKKSVQ